jgi:hypothetical protein
MKTFNFWANSVDFGNWIAESGGFEFDSIIEMSKFMTKTGQTETLFIPSQFFTIEEIH